MKAMVGGMFVGLMAVTSAWSSCTPSPGGGEAVICALAPGGGEEADVEVRFSESGCIEYQPGSLPLVISVPHGGYLMPREIPNRPSGTTTSDSVTQELGREVADAVEALTGGRPGLIINRLQRAKLDPNREVGEGAGGDPQAEAEWRAYHAFIEGEMALIRAEGQRGFYIDLHGQSHDPGRSQLGFSTTADALTLTNSALDNGGYGAASSLIPFLGGSAPFSEILRGPTSLGGRLQAFGHDAVPSPVHPAPGDVTYWNTGYSSYVHGPLQGVDWMSTVLLETANAGVRDTPEHRQAFAEHLAQAVVALLRDYGSPPEPRGRR